MKKQRFIVILGVCALILGLGPVGAQDPVPVPVPEPAPDQGYVLMTPPELEDLVAPVALYPDPLLGIVLPASSHPVQIVQAARFLNANQGAVDPPQGAGWESSVVALLRYPDVLFMLDEQIDWTSRLGDAVYYQMEDVMTAVQEVRRKSAEAGNLVDNEQQVIVREEQIIRIEPANPEVVYVPVYDPQVIYVPTPVVPVITYRVGYYYGPWLPYTCDWYSWGLSINFFYYGGHWHRHHGHHHWKPSHRHGGRHHGDHDWDHEDGHHGDRGGRGGGHDGDRGGRGGGNWEGDRKEPFASDLKTPMKNPGDIVQQKTPRNVGNFGDAKSPANSGVVPRDLKAPSNAGTSTRSLKTPRTVNRSDWYPSNFQSPQVDRKATGRTTMKIPGGSATVQSNQRNLSTRNYYRGSNSGIVQQKVPMQQNLSSRSIERNFSDRKVSAPNYSAPKIPAQNFKVPSAPMQQNFSAPKAPMQSFKAPSGNFGGGGGRGGAIGGGKGGGGGGGKVPK